MDRSFVLFTVIFVLFIQVKCNYANDLVNNLKRYVRSSCFCAENECCSKWGYCGKTDDYCGAGCQAGPCKSKFDKTNSVLSIEYDKFQCIFPDIHSELRLRRYQGLIGAIEQMNWVPVNLNEIIIFLAHVAHETDGLKTVVEYCAKHNTCDNYQSSWCSVKARPNVKYYGRGWFQLFYPCNYYYAGKALGLDLINEPDLVSQSDKIGASTALWYFKESGMNLLAEKGDFGGTTRKLNEYECEGKGGYAKQAARIQTYQRVRKCFALSEANTNLSC